MLDDRMILGGNFWTLFTPGIWKLLHAILQRIVPNVLHNSSLFGGAVHDRDPGQALSWRGCTRRQWSRCEISGGNLVAAGLSNTRR